MSTYQQRLLAQYRAQPSKVWVLAGMSVFGLLLWGRLLLKDPPRVATAEPGTVAASVESSAGDAESGDRAGPAEGPEITVMVPSQLPRDLFRLPSSAQSPDSAESSQQLQVESTDTPRRSLVRDRAEALLLQAIILGGEPRAVINGTSLRPGESIEGFKLLRLERRHADLELNGVVVRLGLQ
ncbi:MAG: hypothetical protein RLN76_12110 [Phycisphaeraceae bacterium]